MMDKVCEKLAHSVLVGEMVGYFSDNNLRWTLESQFSYDDDLKKLNLSEGQIKQVGDYCEKNVDKFNFASKFRGSEERWCN